jgi:predicted Fe-S protein YdhL (DUF1289 family)
MIILMEILQWQKEEEGEEVQVLMLIKKSTRLFKRMNMILKKQLK